MCNRDGEIILNIRLFINQTATIRGIPLKNASRDDRITMIQTIIPGQLACIGEKARRIFPLLTRVLNYFDDRS